MSTGLWILIVILAAVAGVVGGFFFARRYMQNYLKNNPPITDEMLRTMMLQMGQKPSEKKLKQMLSTMQSQARKG